MTMISVIMCNLHLYHKDSLIESYKYLYDSLALIILNSNLGSIVEWTTVLQEHQDNQHKGEQDTSSCHLLQDKVRNGGGCWMGGLCFLWCVSTWNYRIILLETDANRVL